MKTSRMLCALKLVWLQKLALPAQSADRPNVLLMLAIYLGFGDIAVYQASIESYPNPQGFCLTTFPK